ncbi:MAG: calcium-binding EGF-like domain-containing protein [Taibaiella sp.]|nr:calcium-binding EGF-like domain-containing protein [Taibaiella sp.]
MKNKNSSLFITLLATFSCFLLVIYTSCQKTNNNKYTCENLNCTNGGVCRNGVCYCPNGYQGNNCDTGWNHKFIGVWNVHETLTSSDTVGIKKDSLYVINITPATASSTGIASPTAFFMNNFLNNPRINNVGCVVDSPSTKFHFQPGQSFNGNSLVIISGNGSINTTGDALTGTYTRIHLGATTVIYDTLTFLMTRQ